MNTSIANFKSTALKRFIATEAQIDQAQEDIKEIFKDPNYSSEYKQRQIREIFERVILALSDNNPLLVYLKESKEKLDFSVLNREYLSRSDYDRATYQSALASALELAKSLKGLITKEQFHALAADYLEDPLAVSAFNRIVLEHYDIATALTDVNGLNRVEEWKLPTPPRVQLQETVAEVIKNLEDAFRGISHNISIGGTYSDFATLPQIFSLNTSICWEMARKTIENSFPEHI